jgi:hypothetical protein
MEQGLGIAIVAIVVGALTSSAVCGVMWWRGRRGNKGSETHRAIDRALRRARGGRPP